MAQTLKSVQQYVQMRKAKRKRKQKKEAVQQSTVLDENVRLAQLASRLYARTSYGGLNSTRERILSINYKTLDLMAERNSVVAAIIQHRCRQIRPFCKVAIGDGDRGFKILPRDQRQDTIITDQQQERIQQLEDFMLNTGFAYDPEREDDLADFVQYLVRDMLVCDQNTTEVRRTQKGEVFDFWYIDPATIKRVEPESNTYHKSVKYVQLDIEQTRGNELLAEYTDNDLIFDYSNKRSRLRHRGYGYSLLEMCIDVVTTFLFAQTYNKDLFIKEKLPKGFLKIMGDVNSETLHSIRDAWINEMSGYGGKWSVPVVPSGKDGAGIDWQSIGQSNRDMEYLKLMHMVMSLIGAVFGIDLAEIGIRTDNSTNLINDSGEARIQASKDSGLGSVVNYIEAYLNKILNKVDTDYVFRFVGVKDQDLAAEADTINKQITSFKTINEVRKEKGLSEIKEEYADMVLNPSAVQLKQNSMFGEEGAEGDFEQGDDDFGKSKKYVNINV